MNPIYKVYLYIMTFYFAVLTPVSPYSEGVDKETEAWTLIMGCVIHSLIAASLFYFFDWPKELFGISMYNDSFGDLMFSVGLPVALWVFLGYLHYPALMEMFDSEKKAQKEKDEAPARARSARLNAEIDELKKMKRENYGKYKGMIFKNWMRVESGHEPSDDYEIFKTDWFLLTETAKLGLRRY